MFRQVGSIPGWFRTFWTCFYFTFKSMEDNAHVFYKHVNATYYMFKLMFMSRWCVLRWKKADFASLQNTEDRGSLCPVAVVVRKQPKRSGLSVVKGRGNTTEIGSPTSFGWDLPARNGSLAIFVQQLLGLLVDKPGSTMGYFGEPVQIWQLDWASQNENMVSENIHMRSTTWWLVGSLKTRLFDIQPKLFVGILDQKCLMDFPLLTTGKGSFTWFSTNIL